MSLPKKLSRLIVIDNIPYRWMVGPNDGYNIFIAENEKLKGRKVIAYFGMSILTPKEAELIIRQALHIGWNSEQKGAPIIFDWQGNRLRRKNTDNTIYSS